MTKNIIAFANQKGGVGKTTSVINVASILALKGKKVLLIDLDPQGNATTGCGIEKNTLSTSTYEVLIGEVNINDAVIHSINGGFDILGANRNLAGCEIELVNMDKREYKLKQAVSELATQYDFILMDCPPSLSLLTLNGLACASYVVVPLQCEYYALEGITDLLNTISRITQGINPNLEVLGIIRTMFDRRNNLAQQVSEQLSIHFKDKLLKTYVPRNVRLAEAPSFGLPVIKLDKTALGAIAYTNITKELLSKLKL